MLRLFREGVVNLTLKIAFFDHLCMPATIVVPRRMLSSFRQYRTVQLTRNAKKDY